MIAVDYLHLKADMSIEEEASNAWATALVGVETDLNSPFRRLH